MSDKPRIVAVIPPDPTYDELLAALEKHHWPDLVPGDGPCETCGLDAEVWYRRKSVSQT